MTAQNLKRAKKKQERKPAHHKPEYHFSKLLSVIPQMDNLAVSTFVFLVSLSVFFAAPMQESATDAPPRTEMEYLQDLKAGLQVLDAIAMKKLSATLQFAGGDRILNLNLSANATVWRSVKGMCDQFSVLTAAWDIPPKERDNDIILIRAMTQLTLTKSCQLSEYLLRTTYPNSNFSLTCSTHELDRICRDFQTLTFAEEIKKSLITYNANLDGTPSPVDVSQWISRNVVPERLLPEVYQVINATRSFNPQE